MDGSHDREQPRYLLGHSERELDRLVQQGAFYAQFTAELLERAGLSSGMRVLDVGCGAGDVSFLAAKLVGSTGSVLGVDRSEEAVAWARRRAAAAELTHVHFAVAELDGYSLEEPVDFIVGRFVLLYLPDPAKTLRSLARCLRPGGRLAFHEMDIRSGRGIPEAKLYETAIRWIGAVFERAGFQPDMGSKLCTEFSKAGFAIPEIIAGTRVEAGPSSPGYAYLTESVRSLLPMMERTGVATAAEIGIDTLESRLRDEAVRGARCLFFPLLYGAWSQIAK
ncbi:MAG TPA: class I SAM-dependent methyltransferase [Polyangiaceae bacterium]|nr:class I SAM-dependent methyltransferase [Polyangiaceae bacterium]